MLLLLWPTLQLPRARWLRCPRCLLFKPAGRERRQRGKNNPSKKAGVCSLGSTMGEQSPPTPSTGSAAAIPLQSPLASRAPWGWRHGDTPQPPFASAPVCTIPLPLPSLSGRCFLQKPELWEELWMPAMRSVGLRTGSEKPLTFSRTPATHFVLMCFILGMMCPVLGIPECRQVNSGGPPVRQAVPVPRPPGGWWGSCLPRMWMVGGL